MIISCVGFQMEKKKQRNTEVPPNKPSNVEKKYFSEFPQLSDFTYQDKNLG